MRPWRMKTVFGEIESVHVVFEIAPGGDDGMG